MALRVVSGTSLPATRTQVGSATFAPGVGGLTVFAWLRKTGTPSTRGGMGGLGDPDRCVLNIDGTALRVFATVGGSTIIASAGGGTASDNVWYPLSATLKRNEADTLSVLRGCVNGAFVQATTATAFAAGDLYDRAAWGYDPNGDTTQFTGDYAHAAVWHDALSDDELLLLNAGASPMRVRPGRLLAYWPLEHDLGSRVNGAFGLKPAGALAFTDGPRIETPPRRPVWLLTPFAAASGDAVTPNSIAGGAPSVGAPSITQEHALSPTGIASGSPTVGSPALSQEHALAPEGATGGTPTVGAPTLGIEGALSPENTAAGTPTVGAPTLTQEHALSPTGIASGSPTVGTPTAAQEGGLSPEDVAAGTPTVGAPALSQTHVFGPAGIAAGAPETGAPDTAPIYAFDPEDVVSGAPTTGTPGLNPPVVAPRPRVVVCLTLR